LASLHHPDRVTGVAVSPSGGCFLTGCEDKSIRKWNTSTPYIQEWECSLPSSEGSYIMVAFLDDDLFLAGGWGCEQVFLTKVGDGSVVRSYETGSPCYSITALSSNSLLTGHYDGSIKLWETSSEVCVNTFEGHDDHVNSIAKVDEAHFVSGSDDNTAKIWNVLSKMSLYTFSGHTDNVNSVVYMPTGNKLLTDSSDATIKIWSLDKVDSGDVESGIMDDAGEDNDENVGEAKTKSDVELGIYY